MISPASVSDPSSTADVTLIVRMHDRINHFKNNLIKGCWDGVRVHVVCDGTPDPMVDRLRELARDREQIAVHSYSPNRGIAYARGEGFRTIDTSFGAVVDDDDFIADPRSYAARGAAALRAEPDVLMAAMPFVLSVNPLLQPVEKWDLRSFHGQSALDLLEHIVRTGRIRQMGGAMFRTEQVRALDVSEVFRHAEDVVMMARLCGRHPGSRIHVVDDEACTYVRLAHADGGSQTYDTHKCTQAMLAFSVAGTYLVQNERMTPREVLNYMMQRGLVMQRLYGVGRDAARTVVEWLQEKSVSVRSHEAERAVDFLQRHEAQLPQEVAMFQSLLARGSSADDGSVAADSRRECVDVALSTDETTLVLEAKRLLMEGEPTQALSILHEVLEENPNSAHALNDAGHAYVDLGEAVEASRCFERALEADPGHQSAFYSLLDLLVRAESPELAVDVFVRYQEHMPDDAEKGKYAEALGGWAEQQTAQAASGDSLPGEAYVDTTSFPEPGAKDGLRIAVVCGVDRKFITGIEEGLRQIGHAVYPCYYDDQLDLAQIQEAMDWADVTWFEWCDRAFIAATHRLEKTSKVVCRLHSYELLDGLPRHVNWSFVDQLVLVAPHMMKLFKEAYGTPVETICIPNGVNVSSFHYREREPGFNLAFIGYIDHKKNPSLLIQGLKALVDHDERYQLHIAGSFRSERYRIYLEHLIPKLGLDDHVHFYGWVDDIATWLDNKNYLISTSVFESFGYGIAEAMASGIKPVVHDFYGADEIFPSDCIFRTVEELVAIVDSPSYAPRTYRRYINDHFSRKQQLDNITNMLRELVGVSMPTPQRRTRIVHIDSSTRLELPVGDHITEEVEERGFYERELLEYILSTYGRGLHIVDVGAHVGNHTIYFGRVVEAARVDAFEPNPASYHLLQRNIRHNELRNVFPHCLAVGAEAGTARLAMGPLTNTGQTSVALDEMGSTEVVALDDVIEGSVDVIKIDVEGLAGYVLRGGRRLLRDESPALFIECGDADEYESVADALVGTGYYPVQRFNWTPTIQIVKQADQPSRRWPSYEEAILLGGRSFASS